MNIFLRAAIFFFRLISHREIVEYRSFSIIRKVDLGKLFRGSFFTYIYIRIEIFHARRFNQFAEHERTRIAPPFIEGSGIYA